MIDQIIVYVYIVVCLHYSLGLCDITYRNIIYMFDIIYLLFTIFLDVIINN